MLLVFNSVSIMYAIDENSAFNKLMKGYPGGECFDAFERLKQINAIIHRSETVLPTTNLKDAIEKPATFSNHFLRAEWYIICTMWRYHFPACPTF